MKTYYRVEVKHMIKSMWSTNQIKTTEVRARQRLEHLRKWDKAHSAYASYRYRIVKVTEEVVK